MAVDAANSLALWLRLAARFYRNTRGFHGLA